MPTSKLSSTSRIPRCSVVRRFSGYVLEGFAEKPVETRTDDSEDAGSIEDVIATSRARRGNRKASKK
jgi:hypothetical protein